MICFMLGEQLQLSLRLFLLESVLNLWLGGKQFSIKFRNSVPMLVCTFLLNGGLNHIMSFERRMLSQGSSVPSHNHHG